MLEKKTAFAFVGTRFVCSSWSAGLDFGLSESSSLARNMHWLKGMVEGHDANSGEPTMEASVRHKCVKCKGEGSIWDKFAGLSFVDIRVRCTECGGEGKATMTSDCASAALMTVTSEPTN